ncbi:hypothetical protein HDE_04459 [Halotydeus destructor]|nr:hypothetical protein HDE_04459 [Halotydeus destructor]
MPTRGQEKVQSKQESHGQLTTSPTHATSGQGQVHTSHSQTHSGQAPQSGQTGRKWGDVNTFRSSLHDNYEKVKGKGEEEKSKFMDMIQSEKDKLDKEYSEAKGATGEEAEGWISSISGRAQVIADKLKEITEAGKNEVGSWSQAALDKASQLWDSLKEYEQYAEDKARQVAGDIVEGVKDVAGYGETGHETGRQAVTVDLSKEAHAEKSH